jgi:hypothetical protein
MTDDEHLQKVVATSVVDSVVLSELCSKLVLFRFGFWAKASFSCGVSLNKVDLILGILEGKLSF